jgi:hypothetical protein
MERGLTVILTTQTHLKGWRGSLETVVDMAINGTWDLSRVWLPKPHFVAVTSVLTPLVSLTRSCSGTVRRQHLRRSCEPLLAVVMTCWNDGLSTSTTILEVIRCHLLLFLGLGF